MMAVGKGTEANGALIADRYGSVSCDGLAPS